MPKDLAQRQRRQTMQDLDRDQRARARKRLLQLRAELKLARVRRRERLKEVRAACRAARTRISQRAKAARARLNASIKRTRCGAKNLCAVARGEAHAHTLAQIERSMQTLAAERSEQQKLSVWTRPQKSLPSGTRKAERRTESDDEVANNIDDPGLRVVWDAVKSKVKAGRHRSRTEAFYEWAAENSGDVYAIQERDAERHLEQLERQERALSKAVAKRGKYRAPAGLEAVPF